MGAAQINKVNGKEGKNGKAPLMMRAGAWLRRKSGIVRKSVDGHYSRKEARGEWRRARDILGGKAEVERVKRGLGRADKGEMYAKLNGAADAFVRAAELFVRGNRRRAASEMYEAAAEGLLEAEEGGMDAYYVDECYKRASMLFASAARLRNDGREGMLWVRAEEIALGIAKDIIARKHCEERGADARILGLKIDAFRMSRELAEVVEVSADIARGAGKREAEGGDRPEKYVELAEKLAEIAKLAQGGERRDYYFKAACAYRKASEKLGKEPAKGAARGQKKEYEAKRRGCMEKARAVYNAYGDDVTGFPGWHPL